MTATPARITFVTQEMRFNVQENSGLKAIYPLARETEVRGFFSASADAADINAAAVGILGVARSVFEVEVDGIMDLDASEVTPTVTLYADRGMPGGKDFIVTEYRVDHTRQITTLRLYG